MSYEAVSVAHEGAVGILTFERGKVLNAFNPQLIAETNQAMTEFTADDSVRAILVKGAGAGVFRRFRSDGLVGTQARNPGRLGKGLGPTISTSSCSFWDCPKTGPFSAVSRLLSGRRLRIGACLRCHDCRRKAPDSESPRCVSVRASSAMLMPWMDRPPNRPRSCCLDR